MKCARLGSDRQARRADSSDRTLAGTKIFFSSPLYLTRMYALPVPRYLGSVALVTYCRAARPTGRTLATPRIASKNVHVQRAGFRQHAAARRDADIIAHFTSASDAFTMPSPAHCRRA